MRETNTYIMSFNTPKIPEKIKAGYTMERVEQYVPNSLRCYICQKYGHYEDNCRGREVYRKCGQQDPDPHINECKLPKEFANCDGDHLVYTRSSNIWKLEKEIRAMKHKNSIPYYGTRKMVARSKNPCQFSNSLKRKSSTQEI